MTWVLDLPAEFIEVRKSLGDLRICFSDLQICFSDPQGHFREVARVLRDPRSDFSDGPADFIERSRRLPPTLSFMRPAWIAPCPPASFAIVYSFEEGSREEKGAVGQSLGQMSRADHLFPSKVCNGPGNPEDTAEDPGSTAELLEGGDLERLARPVELAEATEVLCAHRGVSTATACQGDLPGSLDARPRCSASGRRLETGEADLALDVEEGSERL